MHSVVLYVTINDHEAAQKATPSRGKIDGPKARNTT
jgi:hypothetical protein